MRILLTHHFPLNVSPAGNRVVQLAQGLEAAGHRVRLLIVDSSAQGDEAFSVRRVVCNQDGRNSDLDFALPVFERPTDWQQAFDELSDEQLDRYRDVLRAALDAEIDTFDPHIVHAEHIWIQGHLALEAGAPYVLTAWGPELAAGRRDPRFFRFAQEAAENAGRIVAVSAAVQREVLETFGDLDGRVAMLDGDRLEPMVALYRDVLRARFGRDLPN